MKKNKKKIKSKIVFIFENIKKFWDWTWNSNSFYSYISAFILGFIIIKFVFFPIIATALNNDFPIVAIVTPSMEHKTTFGVTCGKSYDNPKKIDFDTWFKICGDHYIKYYNISKEDFEDFKFKNGLYVGDVLILNGWINKANIEVGDTIVFRPQDKVKEEFLDLEVNVSFFLQTKGPIIHRVVNRFEENGKVYYTTKGDNNLNAKSFGTQSYITDDKKVYRFDFEDFETKIPEEDIIGVPLLRVPYLGYPKLILSRVIS